MTIRPLLLPLLLAGLAGCVSAPKPLRGEFDAVSPTEAATRGTVGGLVRWGGRIIEVEPGPDRTCLVVLAQALGAEARPRDQDLSQGRFIACRSGFYDPAIFAIDRAVTVSGRISAFETRPIGDYDFTYPVLAADVLYLWPEARDVEVIHFGPLWPMYRHHPWGGYYRSYHAPRKAEPASTRSGPSVEAPQR
jgi:outer membrane lipoprotein